MKVSAFTTDELDLFRAKCSFTEDERTCFEMYKELLDIGEISDTIMMRELVSDVTCELAKAEKYRLNKELTNYDISGILSEQSTKKEKYKHKIEETH